MESRVAVIGIIVEKEGDTEQLNRLLHQYGAYIVGRMGIPYHKRNVNIISVVIDAPADVISALSGRLGMLPGISSKALYSRLPESRGENVALLAAGASGVPEAGHFAGAAKDGEGSGTATSAGKKA